MRIGMMKHVIELWNVTTTVNNYGVEEHKKELFQRTFAAIKHIKNEVVGNNTKSFNKTIEFTIRYNRYYETPDNSMFIVWDGNEYDIINNDNYYSMDKFITLTAVQRSK
ncbi:head-tail adaptor protein [Vibrio parahaemolyticus]|nr:head-tail adaptor protein [Vibrio parahaemolyticus]EJG0013007.1 head-tail adaptor protein [Vibrio parahaemolyticus]EJS9799254.1 head-tail adaptor protein [Vibrio parahaemolyticus]